MPTRGTEQTRRLCVELGKAEAVHHSSLSIIDELCKLDPIDRDSLEPTDWLIPVFESDGEICLRVKETPETAYVGYEDGSLVVNIHNDVFLKRTTSAAKTDDVKELIDRYDPELRLRDHTPFSTDFEGGEE